MSIEIDSETLRKVAGYLNSKADEIDSVAIPPGKPELKKPDLEVPVVLYAYGETREHAEGEYRRRYGSEPVWCSIDGIGGWNCFSEQVEDPPKISAGASDTWNA